MADKVTGTPPFISTTVFQQFLDYLPQAARHLDPSSKNEHWTRWVLGCFAELGKMNGYTAIWTDPDKQTTEFLLDLCWLKDSPSELRLALGLESEWNSKEHVLYDFGKLLQTKATIKVMISALSHQQMTEALNEMIGMIDRLRPRYPEETYLLINMPGSDRAHLTRELTVTGDEIGATGTLRSLGEHTLPLD